MGGSVEREAELGVERETAGVGRPDGRTGRRRIRLRTRTRVRGRRTEAPRDWRPRRCRRRGAAFAEFALVFPFLVMLVVGMLELGRAVMVQQILTNAAREGARRAIRPGESASAVTTHVADYLRNTSVNATTNTVALQWSANPSATSPSWTTVTSLPSVPSQAALRVTTTARASDVGWGLGWFVGNRTFTARVIMRKE